MRTATVFVSVDGRNFNDRKQCEDHEERCFNAWLRDNPVYSKFIHADRDADARRRAVLREFWEFHYPHA